MASSRVLRPAEDGTSSASPTRAPKLNWDLESLFAGMELPSGAGWAPSDVADLEIQAAELPPALFLRARRKSAAWRFSLEVDGMKCGTVGGERPTLRRCVLPLFLWNGSYGEAPTPESVLAQGKALSAPRPLSFRNGDAACLATAVGVLESWMRTDVHMDLTSAVLDEEPKWSFFREPAADVFEGLDALSRWARPEGWIPEWVETADTVGGGFFVPTALRVGLRRPTERDFSSWSAHERLEHAARLKSAADGIRTECPKAAGILDEAAARAVGPSPSSSRP